MSGFAVRLDIQDGPARAIVVDLRQRTGNTTPAMRIIGEIGRSSIIRNFEAGGRPTPWLKSRRAIREGGITLTKTPRLAKSIVFKAGRDQVDIGTNVIYARIHNLGGEIQSPARERVLHFKPQDGRRKNSPLRFARAKQAKIGMKVAGRAYVITMPKREFMLLQPEDWTEIRAALVEYLAKGR
jgi:phage gpG-like protein